MLFSGKFILITHSLELIGLDNSKDLLGEFALSDRTSGQGFAFIPYF